MPNKTKTDRILRLILFLSNSYPKTKEECNSFHRRRDAAFYNYRDVLLKPGGNLKQKNGKYRMAYSAQSHRMLQHVLHFTAKEMCSLSKTINLREEKPGSIHPLKKHKFVSFLNQDKFLKSYIQKEKSSFAGHYYRLNSKTTIDVDRKAGAYNKIKMNVSYEI